MTAIEGDRITVKNQWGNLMYVSRDIVEKMDSASHYAKEVPMNMTGLAELIESVSDTVFTVKFRKQANKENAQEALEKAKYSDLKDKKKLSNLVKEIVEGEECEMVCHLVKAEGNLGRSTVVNLSTDDANKFRQVDHRSIEFIIF